MLPPWAYTAETPADPDGSYQTSLTSFINEAFYNTSGRTFNAGARALTVLCSLPQGNPEMARRGQSINGLLTLDHWFVDFILFFRLYWNSLFKVRAFSKLWSQCKVKNWNPTFPHTFERDVLIIMIPRRSVQEQMCSLLILALALTGHTGLLGFLATFK